MPDDTVGRLRSVSPTPDPHWEYDFRAVAALCHEAAAEIERLRDEVEMLRHAHVTEPWGDTDG
ncbi:unnamed protein product [marine sediment metagenome]|uniref:Uncharacterized protein n=1 Tax=marine sediment metagenome TaxID=412755 RepID=X0UUZ4_9ZZZZ